MKTSYTNRYLSPVFTDGELLAQAEYLRKEVKVRYATCQRVAQEYTCVEQLITADENLQKVTDELEKVINALEENCYDCSWYQS